MPLKMEQYQKSLAQPPLCEQPAQRVIRRRIQGERYSLLLRER